MDENPTPREAGRLPLAIEAVRWVRTGSEILLRISGRWTIEPPIDLPAPAILLGDPDTPERVEALSGTSEAAARAAGGDKPFRAAFALEGDHAALLAGPLRLDLGFGFMPLPEAEAPEGEAPLQPTVVDSAVMAERRAKRAEAAERTTAQRAAEAEAAVDALEVDMARMELRLRESEAAARPPPPSILEEAPALSAADRTFAADLAELRELVARAERAASAAAPQGDDARAGTMRREMDLARPAPESLVAPRPEPAPSPSIPPFTAALLAAERRQRQARERAPADGAQGATSPDMSGLHARLRAELEELRAGLATVRADAGGDALELERQRAAGRRFAAEVVKGVEELREALLVMAQDRDEALAHAKVKDAEIHKLGKELERLRRGVEARERAWDAATELAREAVSTASKAVEEAEQRAVRANAALDEERALRTILDAEFDAIRARADSLDDDLSKGAASLERAESLIGSLRDVLPEALAADRETEAAVVADVPEAAAPVPADSPPAEPWLAAAIQELRRDDEVAATDLLIELFAAQSAVRTLPEPFDLHIPGRPPLRVVPGSSGPAKVRPLGADERPARLSLETNSHLLHVLLTGRARRRPRVRGPWRARRALRRALGPVPLDLADLAAIGTLPPPRALYAALVRRIHPVWLGQHEIVVEQQIDGPRGDRWFVVVSGGTLELRDHLPEGKAAPDATVHGSQVAFAHVLSGKPPPAGEKVTLRGDRLALALLTQWTERARTR